MAKVIRILNGHRQMSNILTILVLVAVVLFSFTLSSCEGYYERYNKNKRHVNGSGNTNDTPSDTETLNGTPNSLSTTSTQNNTTDDVGNGGGTGIESISEQQLQQLKDDVKDKVGKVLDKFNELIELVNSFANYADPKSAKESAECRWITRIVLMYGAQDEWAKAIGLEYNNDGNTDMAINPRKTAYALVGDTELFHNATEHIEQIKKDYKNLTRRMYYGESDQELKARSVELIATWNKLIPLIGPANDAWENLVTAVNVHRAAVRQATGQ
jgi:hypothetical protein